MEMPTSLMEIVSIPKVGVSIGQVGISIGEVGISMVEVGISIPEVESSIAEVGSSIGEVGVSIPKVDISIAEVGSSIPEVGGYSVCARTFSAKSWLLVGGLMSRVARALFSSRLCAGARCDLARAFAQFGDGALPALPDLFQRFAVGAFGV